MNYKQIQKAVNDKKQESNILERILLINGIILLFIGLQSPDIIFNHSSWVLSIIVSIILGLTILNWGLLFYSSTKDLFKEKTEYNLKTYTTNIFFVSRYKGEHIYFPFDIKTTRINLFFVLLSRIEQESKTAKDYNQAIKNLILTMKEENILRFSRREGLLAPFDSYKPLIVIDDNNKQVFYLTDAMTHYLTDVVNNRVNNVFAGNKNWFKKINIFFKHMNDSPVMPWDANPEWNFYDYNSKSVSGYLKMLSDLINNDFKLNEQEIDCWHSVCEDKIKKNGENFYSMDIDRTMDLKDYQKKAIRKLDNFFDDFDFMKAKIQEKELKRMNLTQNKKKYDLL